MGCDIHPIVEVRAVTGYTRNDKVIRELQRRVEHDGSPEFARQLEAYTVREGPWELAAYPIYVPQDLEDFTVLPTDKEHGSKLLSGFSHATSPSTPGGVDWTTHFATKFVDPSLQFNEWRNYQTFELLAGVRPYQGYEIISSPRGIPEDLSISLDVLDNAGHSCDEQHPLAWVLGDHSFSWLLLSEIYESDKLCQLPHDPLSQPILKAFYSWYLRFGAAARLVFGFDS